MAWTPCCSSRYDPSARAPWAGWRFTWRRRTGDHADQSDPHSFRAHESAAYTEAITAQPGYTTSKRVEDWLFRETVLGAALWRLRSICLAGEDQPYGYLGRNSVVPDRQINPAS